MAVTKSSKQTVKSPDGNSLAIFVDISDGVIKLKDINGNVQTLTEYISVSGGTLQIQGGLPITSTLQNVVDQNGNSSQLQLATNGTKVDGNLEVASDLDVTGNTNIDGNTLILGTLEVNDTTKIKTSTETYLDIEDGLGNNRFTISKGTGSQKVTLDYASNPTSGLEIVGSIRTFQDGANLSDVINFRKDGLVGVFYGLNLNASALSNFIPNLPSTAVNLSINSSNSASYNCAVLSLTGAINVSVDNTVPDGFSLTIVQLDANQCTIVAGSGLTLRNRLGNTKSAGQWAVITIMRLASNLILTGDTGV